MYMYICICIYVYVYVYIYIPYQPGIRRCWKSFTACSYSRTRKFGPGMPGSLLYY